MEDILKINRRLINDSVSDLVDGSPEIEDLIFERVREFLYEQNIKGGNFDVKDVNVAQINKIKKIVREVLELSGYDDRVDTFVEAYEDVTENTIKIHKESSGINVPKKLLNGQQKFAIDNTLFSLKSANIDTQYIEPLRKVLFRSITLGGSVLETENELRNLIKGVEGRSGIIERWVGQVSRDALNQYQGSLHTAVMKEYEMDEILYVGSLVTDSRSQCRRWVAKEIIKFSELQQEIDWALSNGTGFIKTTTPSSFLINRGGYNCRHEAIPV